MKALLITSALFLATTLITGGLYLDKLKKLAVAQEVNKDWSVKYESLQQKARKDQEAIVQSNKEKHTLSQINRRLRRDFDKQSIPWRSTVAPEPVDQLVRELQETAHRLSTTQSSLDSNHPDP